MSRGLTCIVCDVLFTDFDQQKDHYRSQWHKYNSLRQIEGLETVTQSEFDIKVHEVSSLDTKSRHNNKVPNQKRPVHLVCDMCNKTFKSENTFKNHEQSRIHLVNQQRCDQNDGTATADGTADDVMPDESGDASDDAEEEEEDMEVEELSDDEWNATPLEPHECLFCGVAAASPVANAEHMEAAHSFRLPDAEYVVDLEALLDYLGHKVGAGHVCLWCGKRFHTTDAVQKHMPQKGHCKIRFDSTTALEFADFYLYDETYLAGVTSVAEVGGSDPDSGPSGPDLDLAGLVLPSGAVIGHRALARYYRQSLPPARAAGGGPGGALGRPALGWRGPGGLVRAGHTAAAGQLALATPAERVRRTDMAYVQRRIQQSRMRLGVKANKFQTYFRCQNPV